MYLYIYFINNHSLNVLFNIIMMILNISHFPQLLATNKIKVFYNNDCHLIDSYNIKNIQGSFFLMEVQVFM